MYFKVDINDTYNAAVIGQTISYCLNDYCEVPNVKGNHIFIWIIKF